MTTKQIKLKDYPELNLAHNFVSKIHHAVIAGGVARDILLNSKLSDESDIDIFIGESKDSMPERLLDIFNVCNNLKIEPRIVESYSVLSGVRIKAGDLDITLLEHVYDVAGIVSMFDMVSSQAWLVPTNGGFEVCATDLFHELSQRKVLGYYPGLCKSPSNHISHIAEQFPDHMLLALSDPSRGDVDNDFDDDIPF